MSLLRRSKIACLQPHNHQYHCHLYHNIRVIMIMIHKHDYNINDWSSPDPWRPPPNPMIASCSPDLTYNIAVAHASTIYISSIYPLLQVSFMLTIHLPQIHGFVRFSPISYGIVIEFTFLPKMWDDYRPARLHSQGPCQIILGPDGPKNTTCYRKEDKSGTASFFICLQDWIFHEFKSGPCDKSLGSTSPT